MTKDFLPLAQTTSAQARGLTNARLTGWAHRPLKVRSKYLLKKKIAAVGQENGQLTTHSVFRDSPDLRLRVSTSTSPFLLRDVTRRGEDQTIIMSSSR